MNFWFILKLFEKLRSEFPTLELKRLSSKITIKEVILPLSVIKVLSVHLVLRIKDQTSNKLVSYIRT